MKNSIFLKTSVACLSLLGIASLFGVSASPSYAATFEPTPFETLTIDSETPLTPVFSSILSSGVQYKVEASGLFSPDFRLDNWDVDARFVSRDNFATVNDLDPSFGNFDFGLFSAALGGNNDDFWGSYQSSHLYSYEFNGTGSSVDFYVNDIGVSSGADNSGIFTVNIFREQTGQSVPEPSAMLGLLAVSGLGLSKLKGKKGK
jgi:hypothetical protein